MSIAFLMNWRVPTKKASYISYSSFCTRSMKIFSFLMVSSLFIAITGFFETFIGYLLLGMNPSLLICSAVFFVTFSTYSLNKLTDVEEDAINMPERSSFLTGHRRLVILSILTGYVLCVLLTLLAKPLAVPILFVPLVAGFLYSLKLHPVIPRLKDIPVMKSITVALSWSCVCTLLPAVNSTDVAEVTIASVFYFILAKVFIDATLYDVRDIEGDKATGIRTIPVLIGTRKTTPLLLAINSTILPCVALVETGIRPLAILMIFYGYAYILYFRKRRNPMALDFFVDGQWMLASIMFIMLKGVGVII